MAVNFSRTPRVLVGAIIRVMGRALIGALAGLILVSLTLTIATDYVRLFAFENSVAGDRSFWKVVGLGTFAFALIAVFAGDTKIRGRAGTTIKGVLAGALVGIMVGPALDTFGILLGGPIGAILGGIISTQQDSPGRREKGPGVADVGLRDPLE